ncbi:unnamed protein product [Sphagnum balticum]
MNRVAALHIGEAKALVSGTRRNRERRQHAACRRQHVISEGLSRHGKNFVMVGARKDSETRPKNRIDHAQIVDNPVLARHRLSCLDVLISGGYTVNCRLLHTPCTFFALVRKR